MAKTVPLPRQMVCECTNVSELVFGNGVYPNNMGSKLNFGVELTPYFVKPDPYFTATDFKLYIEHCRIKGEFMIHCNNIQDISNHFNIGANKTALYFDKRQEGKKEFVRLIFENIDFYEIQPIVQQEDKSYQGLLKFILKGLKVPDTKVINTSRTGLFWAKRMGLKLYEHVK